MPEASPVVFLVHGTFAPRAKWANDEKSPFRRLLQGRLGPAARLVPYEWGGALSQPQREKRAREFREAIGRELGDDRKRPVFLVGHSHGGNVALHAAGVRDSDGIRPLIPNLRGVCCLATPFISRRIRNLDPAIDTIAEASGLFLLCLFIVGTVAFASAAVAATVAYLGAEVGMGLVAASALLITMHVVYGAQRRGEISATRRSVAETVRRHLRSRVAADAEAASQQRRWPNLPPAMPGLAIWVRKDEALAWIGFWSAVARMPFRLSMNPVFLRALVTGWWVLLAYLALKSSNLGDWSAFEPTQASATAELLGAVNVSRLLRLDLLRTLVGSLGAIALAVGVALAAWVMAIVLVALLCGAGHTLMRYGPLLRFLAWGPETRGSRWLIDIGARREPAAASAGDGSCGWTVQPVEAKRPWWRLFPFGCRLRHSIYQEEDVTHVLGDWIAARLDERTDP